MTKKKGRPSKYTDEIAAEICRQIAEGKSLVKITEDIGVSYQTVLNWLHDNETFLGKYARAREQQADFYADEMVTIADTTDDPNKARLQIDARKWKASKLAPKKYGDKLSVDATISTHDDWIKRQAENKS